MAENPDQQHLDEGSIKLLRALGVLDGQNHVTPEAYIGFVTRRPVNEQAQALGIPLVLLPPPRGEESPESTVSKFFSKEKGLHVDGGYEESYLLRSFITSVAVGFNAKKKKHSLSHEKVAAIAKTVSTLTEEQVIRLLEENNVVFQPHFGFAYSIQMPERADESPYTMEKLIERFFKAACYQLEEPAINDLEENEARCNEFLRSKEGAKHYAKLMLTYLWVWRSLSSFEWSSLIKVVLENWDKMATGWPDINIVGPETGLILVEVKGKDKLHTSQVYTLLKLKEVLGPQRFAIAWVNRIAMGVENREHQESVWEWVRTSPENRANTIKHPKSFYCASKVLLL